MSLIRDRHGSVRAWIFYGSAFVAILLAMAGIGGLAGWIPHRHTHDGQHVGIVTAVSHGGIFWKTTSAWFKTDAESTQEDRYCVTDPAIRQALQDAADKRLRVRIEYHGYLMWSEGCTFDSDETIYRVTEVAQ